MTGLLPVEDAQTRLLALRDPLAPENIGLSESLGRYLSDDVLAQRGVRHPRRDRSWRR